MFIDWSPLPDRVLFVEPGRDHWVVAIPPKMECLYQPDAPPWNIEMEVVDVPLQVIEGVPKGFLIKDNWRYQYIGHTVRRAYGWEPKTRTLITWNQWRFIDFEPA
jgi:hypothetical protein